MHKHNFLFRTFGLALVAAAALSACGGGDDGPRDVAIEFAAVSGSTPVRCGTAVAALGSTSATAQVKDFRFYISNVKLVRADGAKVTLELPANGDWNHTQGAHAVTLVDLEDGTGSCAGGTAATNSFVRGKVPAGDYVGVEMTMGVPFALNHTDTTTAPRPLDIAAMAWSWQAGRKFAKIEVTDPDGAAGTWAAKTFNFHLGSTGCTGNPATGETVTCAAAKRMDFAFSAFNPDTQRVVVDLQALLNGNDITVNAGGAAGCMSGSTDPECPAVFQALAVDLASGLPINGGQAQTLFKVRAK